jgi:poly-beta-1,6-N-acetyl-D-glucosamine N-deacetylase
LKRYIFKIFRLLTFPRFFKILKQRKTVTILIFHDLGPKTADMAFAYLFNNYNIISLNTFIEAQESGDCNLIPSYALIITFDDGHKNNYKLLDIIKKHNVPVTIFLCSGIIDTYRHFWFKYQKLENFQIHQLKKVSNSKRLEFLLKEGFNQTEEYTYRQALSLDEINEMEEFVDFQSHTIFHPCLPNCNYIEAKNEIFNSKNDLENKLHKKIFTIAYPNGDYSERDLKLCKQSGYKCGLTADYGFNTISTDPFKLKRLIINDTDNLDEIIVKSSGFWDFLKTINGKKQDFGYVNNTCKRYKKK